MNYRHAFHAGNFADCVKHAILLELLTLLQRKPKPLFILDTHAGPGFTDLSAESPNRTGEYRNGILRLLDTPPPPLAPYANLVTTLGLYPGSPALLRARLRDIDRLALCELHPEDFRTLRARFARDPRTSTHHRDGYEALAALLPPPERRALVLIDPPYEQSDEFERAAAGIARATRRLRDATIAAWYPIKHLAPVRAFHASLQAANIPDIVAADFLLREPLDPTRLNGCGLAIINPPYGCTVSLPPILDALLARLGQREPGEAARLTRLANE